MITTLICLFPADSASIFRGGYYSHGKQFIAKLPIYRIDWDDEKEIAKHGEIVEKVHLIEGLVERMKKAQNSSSNSSILEPSRGDGVFFPQLKVDSHRNVTVMS